MVARVPELEGGDWERGRKIFFGDAVGCYKCHQIHGEGGTIGADLSNLIYRDYASVLRDITEPSAAINPEHISYNVELKDGNGKIWHLILYGKISSTIPKTLSNAASLTIDFMKPQSKIAGKWFLSIPSATITRSA